MNVDISYKKDIDNLEDIRLLVDQFYSKVRNDGLIGPIFTKVIGNRWPKHLDTMYKFWETLLLDEHTYHGAPFPPHAPLPIDETHFKQWILLFKETVDFYFSGKKAEEAKWRADKMAALFTHKLEYFRKSGHKPLI
jgi:hemoglobin